MTPYPPAPPPPRRGVADTVATVLAGCLLVVAVLGALWSSLFFVMATDSCGINDCRESRLAMAYVATWGGLALAVVTAVAGCIRAARRRTVMWIWPAIAVLIVGAALAAGALLATSIVVPA